MTFAVSAVVVALNAGSIEQRLEHAGALGDLVENFEIAIVSDLDRFVTIADVMPAPIYLPWLPDAVA
jgi:hypothetical protein